MSPKRPIIEAKLHVPELPTDLIIREKVNEKLERKKDSLIFLFSAPAGYGKSTTVASWLLNSGVNCCWFSIDENDNVLKTFLQYFVTTIQNVAPKFGKELEEILESNQEASLRDYKILLTNAVTTLEKKVYLTLDDYHFIRNQEIHDLLIFLFKYPQQNLKLVIISRKDPPFPISRWRIKNKLAEMHSRDLVFNFNEITEFLNKQRFGTFQNQTIKKFEEITEGWITGLRLLSYSGAYIDQKNYLESIASLENEMVLIELIQEILKNQKPGFREAILKMSLVEEFNQKLFHLIVELKDDVSESNLRFDKFVETLLHSNLFLIPLDTGHDWFRFHHLFHSLLKQICLNECSEKDIHTVYENIALWYKENDQMERCIEYTLKLNRESDAIQLFSEFREIIFQQSEWQTLDRLLILFGERTIEKYVVLGLSNAWLLIYKGDIHNMRLLLPGLEEQCLSTGLMGGMQGHYLGEINAMKAYARYNFDIDMLICLEHASTALALLGKNNLYAIGLAWVFYGGALQALGKSNVARKEILDRLNVEKSAIVKSNLYLILCYINWMDGKIADLAVVSTLLINLGKSNQLKEAEANGYYFSGCANFSRNNQDKALEDFKSLYDLRHFTLMVHRFFGSAALVFLLLDQVDDRHAKLLEEMHINAIERGGELFIRFVQAISAVVDSIKTKSAESLKWAMETPHLPLLPMSNFTSIPMLQSYILVFSGNADYVQKGIEILDDCQWFLDKYNNQNFLTKTYVLKSLGFVNLGNWEEAEKFLKKALKIAVPRDLYSTFSAFEFEDLSKLVKIMELTKIELEFVEKVLGFMILKKSKENVLLSNRELQILESMRGNLRNKEIAQKLFIAESTVKRHVANIYKKLGVHKRHQALDKAKKLSL